MYEVQWVHPAISDLHVKVRSTDVRRHLQSVARTALDRHHPPWGGRVDDLCWRRGVTVRDELALDAEDGEDLGPGEHAYDFVLVYERSATLLRCYVVLGILTNAELLASLGAGITTVARSPSSNGTGRRARITRRPRGASDRR